MVLMLYHSFGPSFLKPIVDRDSLIYQRLGDEGMILYKCIFDNNNKDLVKEFFNDSFIRKLWPMILNNLTAELCFGKTGPNPDIETTFIAITGNMAQEHRLALPQWWRARFPAAAK
jgi:hypothetical protein